MFELYRLYYQSSESVHAIEIFATFVARAHDNEYACAWNWMGRTKRFALIDAAD